MTDQKPTETKTSVATEIGGALFVVFAIVVFVGVLAVGCGLVFRAFRYGAGL